VIVGLAFPAAALPPATSARVVGAARELLGVKYQLGGRLRTMHASSIESLPRSHDALRFVA
jgi:hypothetical protein